MISGEIIDAVLARGSGVHEGKLRIFEQYALGQSEKENAAFLKQEYGIGGTYPALTIDGQNISEDHDGSGIRLRVGMSGPIKKITWSEAAKRIGRLISDGRYLNEQERAAYTDYLFEKAEQAKRSAVADRFRTLVREYAADHDALNRYVLSDCADAFTTGRKTTWTLTQGNWILPLMRSALQQIVSDGTPEQQAAIDLLKALQRPEAAALEPSEEELHPAIPIYKISVQPGDQVWLNGRERQIVSVTGEERVSLADPDFPLFTDDLLWDDFRREMLADCRNNPFTVILEHREMTQAEIDDAICKWNGSEQSKSNVIRYLQEHGAESGAAAWLAREYGTEKPLHFTVTGTDADVVLEWPEIQSRLVSLIANGSFHADSGFDTPSEAAPVPVEESQKKADSEPKAEETVPREYRVGDTLVLDGTAYTVEKVGMFDITMSAGGQPYPVSRVESKENLERLLRLPENNHLHNLVVSLSSPVGSNFHFQSLDRSAGPKDQFRKNLDAVALLRTLQAEGRAATADEQAILARYAGWGGLAAAFDDQNESWTKEYKELSNALTPGEYLAARASTLDAHYTAPEIIRGMYAVLENMGFSGGNILEPAAGIGNFLGAAPEDLAGRSRFHAVELDPLSGEILKKLYPGADVTIGGFETTRAKSTYDLAIGNVPFGQIKVNDPELNRYNFSIHNYFFAKALSQVRPGGIVAFITSRYTMDAKSTAARRYIAQRAELLGAIRLPNNAFANAGTEAVADILFLQKRPEPIKTEPDWVSIAETKDGFPVNAYFAQHPEMILGTLQWVSGPHGQTMTVEPLPDADLEAQIRQAGTAITGHYMQAVMQQPTVTAEKEETLPGDPDLRPWSFAIRNDGVYFQEDADLKLLPLGKTAQERVKAMVPLRDTLRELIALQADASAQEADLQGLRDRLNDLYDRFTAKFGHLNDSANTRIFQQDSVFPLLTALEKTDSDGNVTGKADIFFRRTVRPYEPITHADTATDALAVSLGELGRVDLSYMASLTGKTEAELESELTGVVFRDVRCRIDDPKKIPFEQADLSFYPLVTADEYLSGNVREKLRMANRLMDALPQEQRQRLQVSIDALTAAQPKDLEATEIAVRLGSTWIPTSDIEAFIREVLKPPVYASFRINVEYSALTGEWHISGADVYTRSNVTATATYGTSRMDAYEILERTLNMREVRIYDVVHDRDGEHRVPNQKETTIAQQKQQSLQDAFQEWIWEDPERRQRLTALYNERFNAIRPREYDGSHLRFIGANPEISLRPHQLGAIAHIIYGGNTLLAHVVGAGKTYEMIASIMESKRLGLCKKAMIAVPNHLTEQWGSEFMTLYPAANILVAREKDFAKENRRKLFARIATGDYDAIIVGHSQFERIPVSLERQRAWIQSEIDEITDGLRELKFGRSERFSVKQLERMKKNLESRLEKLSAQERKDDFLTFEELGVDRLYVDEAQAYKNLFCPTKMTRVAGLSTAESQRSADMLCKCRYLDELTGSRGVVFATGTPVSNSMVELYTMQRYLQNDRLRELGFTTFDSWASTFGETVTAMELAPEGTGYRSRTRFARFYNLPELMSIFREVADIKTADQLNLPVPEVEYRTCVAKPTQIQQELVQQLAKRAAEVHAGNVESEKDNMLKITSDGRKLGLDQRLIDPEFPDEAGSKVNFCVQNVLREYENGTAERLTQMIFCDLSTPKTEGFSVYTDLKAKLIQGGIPENQIAFIHDADTAAKKKALFEKMRSGEVRVLLGSTQKMGAGTNCQDRMIAIHDLDAPWRPGDLEQRKGRLVRQGNRNQSVRVYRYVTEGTFDAYLWQTLENKQRFISQIMTSKSPVRSAEDADEAALSYAEVKALCAGDPRVKEKMDLDVEVAKLRVLKSDYLSQRYRLQNDLLHTFPEEIKAQESLIKALEEDQKLAETHPAGPEKFAGITVEGVAFSEKEAGGEAILALLRQGLSRSSVGTYRGFQLNLERNNFDLLLVLQGSARHFVTPGKDAKGNFTRMDHVLEAIPERIRTAKNRLEALHLQVLDAKTELEKPWPQEEMLREKSQRLVELNAELDMDAVKIPEETPAKRKISGPEL